LAEKPVPSVIWMRPTRGSRGPEPSRDRDAIARTAIAIADHEGLAAVSMRRVAAEIGTGTSSLYRYFSRKDDLLNLMVDGALAGDVLTASGHWRRDLEAMGHGLRRLFKAHPWLATALAGRPTLGPNRLRALEGVLDLLKDTGLSLGERLVLVDTLGSYVRGFVASEIADTTAIAESGLSSSQWQADQAAYAEAIAKSGHYPLATQLFEEFRAAGTGGQDKSFAAGLEIVLDGLARRLGG
jgi:AcrR family transcriptional regulator